MSIFKDITGTGQDVVIIHGGGASHLDMVPIAKKLAPHYRVTNIDLPGTGQSMWDPNIHNIHDLADYTLKELPKKAIYIGWSFGGLIAQSIAARYPARISHLIGIASTPKFIEANDWPGFPQPGYSSIVTSLLKEGNEAKSFLEMFYEYDFEPINPKPPAYYEAKKIWTQPSTLSNEMLLVRMNMVDKTDLRELFKSIKCPIDLILGGEDPNVPKALFAKIKELNPFVKIHEIQESRHAPFWTYPEKFNEILDRILYSKNH